MSLSRGEIMRRIRGADTTPELALRRALHAAGVRYRLGQRVLGARPDLVFAARALPLQSALFIDGCLWHGCPWHYTAPRTRAAFWADKLARNVERDIRQTVALRAAGWQVLRVFEHDVAPEPLAATAARVARAVRGDPEAAATLRPGPRVHRVDPLPPTSDGAPDQPESRRRERWVLWDLDAEITESIVERDRPSRRPG